MVLPLSRNETPAAGTQVKSATNVDLQDAIIQRSHGSIVSAVGIHGGLVSSGSGTKNPYGFVSDGGSDWIDVDLDFPEGTIIEGILVRANQVGATPISWHLVYLLDSSTSIVTIVNEAGDATTGYKDIEQTGIAHTMAVARAYKLRIKSTSQAGDTFKRIAILHHMPIV